MHVNSLSTLNQRLLSFACAAVVTLGVLWGVDGLAAADAPAGALACAAAQART